MIKRQPSVIEWRQKNDQLIAFEDGQSLDLPENSMAQVDSSHAVIIGLGSGFLLEKLLIAYPTVEFTVIECRESLVSRFSRKYESVNFILIESIDDLESHPQVRMLQAASTQKILNDQALGSQKSFLQEVFWHLNLRTARSLQTYFQIEKPIDDRWLINAKQLLEVTTPDQLPYKLSEVLVIKELVK